LIDFVSKRNFYYLLSLLIVLPGVISLILPGGFRTGIEFSSGTTFTARFEQPVMEADMRAALAELGHPGSRVQRTGDGKILVRTRLLEGVTQTPPIGPAPPSEREEIEAALQQRFGPLLDNEGQPLGRFIEFASVSPSVSADIGRNAAIAVAVASLAILAYITMSFLSVPSPVRYGFGAIFALFHDVLLVLGAASIAGRLFNYEMDTLFITAMLTIVGFSVHDSIVVFDRIRENVRRSQAAGYEVALSDAVNSSLNQTMARSLNTSVTALLVLFALVLLGGDTIRAFLSIMAIGIIAGTYSSIFVACQVLVSWEEGDVPKFFRRIRGRQVEATA
jgi:preprotein translocase subunit SecF